jgi:hypothetical protein
MLSFILSNKKLLSKEQNAQSVVRQKVDIR